jgi:hypothetical protein
MRADLISCISTLMPDHSPHASYMNIPTQQNTFLTCFGAGAPALDQLTDWEDGSMWLTLVSGTPDDVAAAVGELKGRLNESEEAGAEIAKTPGVVIGTQSSSKTTFDSP